MSFSGKILRAPVAVTMMKISRRVATAFLLVIPLKGRVFVVDGSLLATDSALEAFKNLDYRYFVAGGTCAAISHGITTPIDVVSLPVA